MKKILFCVLISFAVCSCLRPFRTSGTSPNQQIFFMSPVTIIDLESSNAEPQPEDTDTVNKPKEDDTRCSIYDNECQKNFFQNIAVQFAPVGIPALGIPVLDPFAVTNVTLSILGLLDLTLIEGAAEGIGKCVVTKFVTNVEARYREPNIICKKIVIKGRYKLTSHAVSSIMGSVCEWCNIHGEGNLNIELDDWFFKFRYPFRIVRRTDGEIYLNGLFDDAVYQTNVGKVTVDVDSVFVGKHDISKPVANFINNHWKRIMQSNVGKFIYDKSAQYYYDIYRTFFDKSPANTYLKDDLTPLINN